MRHAYAYADVDGDSYAYADSNAYGNSHRDALGDTDVHAGTDNNTLRLE